MKRDDVLAVLRSQEAELRRRGVARVALFGSLARGDARADSDIDVMVEIDPNSRMDLWSYVGVVHFIQELFPGKVDVSNREAQKDYVRPSAERDAIYAF